MFGGFTIRDGSGSGRQAHVDEEGRVTTRADMVPHPQHHSMTHKNLFLVHFCVTLQATDVEEPLGVFTNLDSDVDFEFYFTQISSPQNVKIKPRFDDFYTAGGQIVTPRNLNRGSGLPLPSTRAQVYEAGALGNLSLSSTSGVSWGGHVYVGGYRPATIEFQGGLILTTGRSVAFYATGQAGTEVCIFAMVSYHEAGTEL